MSKQLGVGVIGFGAVTQWIEMAQLSLIFLGATIHITNGKCSITQQEICRKAAVDDGMQNLAEAGSCMDKQYVQFTHVCTVNKYAPYLNFCCCVHESAAVALCCRYHHHWNYFRCAETDDTVATLGRAINTLSFDIALPTALLLVAVGTVICCYCCYCCCLRYSCQLIDRHRHRLRHHNSYDSSNNSCWKSCYTADYCCYEDDPQNKSKVTTCLYSDDQSAFQPMVRYSIDTTTQNSTPQKLPLVVSPCHYHGIKTYLHRNVQYTSSTDSHGNNPWYPSNGTDSHGNITWYPNNAADSHRNEQWYPSNGTDSHGNEPGTLFEKQEDKQDKT